MNTMITENDILDLRQQIKERMSEKRSRHTLAVEEMAVRLGKIYAPDELITLRVAALLHDITKELSFEEQLDMCKLYGVVLNECDVYAPKTLHAITAAASVPDKFASFADEKVISAVRWHTTGKKGMSIVDKLIYLADYIDDTRTFEDCVKLRDFFFNFDFDNTTMEEKLGHLRDTLIMSFDMTVYALYCDGSIIANDTINARNELICEKLKANEKKG